MHFLALFWGNWPGAWSGASSADRLLPGMARDGKRFSPEEEVSRGALRDRSRRDSNALAASHLLPPSHRECPEIPGQTLVYVHTFDGSPENQADLVPDQHIEQGKRAANIWQLNSGPEWLFVKCGYGKTLVGTYSRIKTLRSPESTRARRAEFRTGRGRSDLTLIRFSCH